MHTLLTVVGARPQLIKAAVVSRVIRASDCISEILVHTGQHYDENMSGVFLQELDIPAPEVNLQIGSGTHGAQTARMLEALEQVMLRRRPSCVLVYGDTNSTLAGALAAVKLHIPVVHVEAGLRSFNEAMPEEINRVLTDRVASLLFTPTAEADANLAREGVPADRIRRVGDVMYDAVLHDAATSTDEHIGTLGLAPGGYVLATIHRAENTDEPTKLRVIVDALDEVARTLPVVLPLHPRALRALDAARLTFQRVRTLAPQGYRAMMALERHARIIITDSGGVQKEAYFHGVPCVTLRAETEWVELIDAGWNRLAPPQSVSMIAKAVASAMELPPVERPAFYGNGRAGEIIIRELTGWLNALPRD